MFLLSFVDKIALYIQTVRTDLIEIKIEISGVMHHPAKHKTLFWNIKYIIGMKQLVLKVAKILEKIRYLWKCEIWGNIVKIWYFVNNCLIKAWI